MGLGVDTGAGGWRTVAACVFHSTAAWPTMPAPTAAMALQNVDDANSLGSLSRWPQRVASATAHASKLPSPPHSQRRCQSSLTSTLVGENGEWREAMVRERVELLAAAGGIPTQSGGGGRGARGIQQRVRHAAAHAAEHEQPEVARVHGGARQRVDGAVHHDARAVAVAVAHGRRVRAQQRARAIPAERANE
jgi:hypothetical protein